MSTILNNERRTWFPVAVAASLLLAGLWGMIALRAETRGSGGATPARAAEEVAASQPVALPQAAWATDVYPAGGGRPTKADRDLLAKESDAVSRVLSKIYDRYVLGGTLEGLRGAVLTQPVAQALAGSKLRLPEGMSDIQGIRRGARIGIDTVSRRRAAVQVSLNMKASLKDNKVRFRQRWVLWLEKNQGGWQVVAFEGDQVPSR